MTIWGKIGAFLLLPHGNSVPGHLNFDQGIEKIMFFFRFPGLFISSVPLRCHCETGPFRSITPVQECVILIDTDMCLGNMFPKSFRPEKVCGNIFPKSFRPEENLCGKSFTPLYLAMDLFQVVSEHHVLVGMTSSQNWSIAVV